MKTFAVAAGFAAVAAVSAQRPEDQSICDYYTTALLKENNAKNQETLLTLVVNTAVIGNYTQPNVGIKVPGILANGTGEYEGVSLAPYFTGALKSSNRGGSSGVAVNFLDGGGAEPLMKNMAANDDSSRQYKLLTHLYSYFGVLLGCSQFANSTGQYDGFTSQYQVHKYMGLGAKEVGYFISQVGASAASFGVTEDDVTAVGKALTDAFDYKCAPPAAIPPTASPDLQAICIADDCMLSPQATCDAYEPVIQPMAAETGMPTSGMNSSTGSASSTSGGGGSKPTGTGATMMPTGTGGPQPSTGAASTLFPIMSALTVGVMGVAVMLL